MSMIVLQINMYLWLNVHEYVSMIACSWMCQWMGVDCVTGAWQYHGCVHVSWDKCSVFLGLACSCHGYCLNWSRWNMCDRGVHLTILSQSTGWKSLHQCVCYRHYQGQHLPFFQGPTDSYHFESHQNNSVRDPAEIVGHCHSTHSGSAIISDQCFVPNI